LKVSSVLYSVPPTVSQIDSDDCALTLKNVEKEKINAKTIAKRDLIVQSYP
jgi:hypothetical protein